MKTKYTKNVIKKMDGQPKKFIGTIDAIRVIMNPLDWYKKKDNYDYDVQKILFRHKYIHVFIYEKKDNWFWDMKFDYSLINSIKNWLKNI